MLQFDTTFDAFNTTLRFSLCANEARGAQTKHAAQEKAARTLSRLHTLCESYEQLFSRTIETSDVSRINSAGGKAVAVASETSDLIRQSLPYCKKSHGVFDITAGCITSLWDFHCGRVPSAHELQHALPHVDWRTVSVFQSGATHYVQLADPDAALDLGGIAKGWIADSLCNYLQGEGYTNFLINLGGNVLAQGKNAHNEPWVIEVINPFAAGERILLHCSNESVVTSGTYERCFHENGVLLHHILDPRTGRPVITDAVSATIVCETSLDAEGFSTTALALGIERGLAFCKEQPEITGAVFLDARGNVHGYNL